VSRPEFKKIVAGLSRIELSQPELPFAPADDGTAARELDD
jgi:hypothetical protein